MAIKTLDTRISLRYDTLENWQKSDVAGRGANLVLNSGEMGICYVPGVTQGTTTTAPTVLFKVGDGTQTFAQLPWASGLAADVYDWAKATTKPTYTASEITGLSDFVSTNETNTQYQWVADGPNKFKLQSKEKNGSWSDVSGQVVELVQDATNGHKIGFKINGTTPTQWITIPDSDVNQTVKAGSVTFGSNDVVNFVGGGDITVTGNSTDKTITISATSPSVGDGALTVVAGSTASGTFTANQSGNSTITIDATTHQELTSAINALDVTDTAVVGKYVSAVSETDGKISVTRADLPSVSVSENTATVPTSDTVDVWTGATGSGHTITAAQATMPTKKYVDDQIATVSGGVVFKGTLGTGGTISTLPSAAGANKGHMYKVITDGTYAGQAAKVGDLFISSGSSSTAGTAQGWYYIPSGDEPSGTVTNIATGTGLTGGPITTTGTISHATVSGGAVSASAKKVGYDNLGHVVLGDTLAAADVGADASGTAQGLINALDKTVSGMANNKTLATLTQTDGIISATFQDIHVDSNNIDQSSGDILVLNCGNSTTNI